MGLFPTEKPGETWADAVRVRGEVKKNKPWFPLRVAGWVSMSVTGRALCA